MEFQLVENSTNIKLSYYAKGSDATNEEGGNLLGFKDNFAVLDSDVLKVKYISLTPNSKLETDQSGQRFVNWKGRILKIVPPGHIPKAIQEQTMKLKKQWSNMATKTLSGTGRTLTKLNPFPIELVNKDNNVNISNTIKNVRLITQTAEYQVIHSSTAESAVFPVNPAISSQVSASVKPPVRKLPEANAKIKVQTANLASVNNYVDDRILPAISGNTCKLLCAKNLGILNQVKMKALNLSMKSLKDNKEVTKCVAVEVGVQTDELNIKKQLCHQQVQTDILHNFNLVDYVNLESLIDNTSNESPIIRDVSLGTGPTLNRYSGKGLQEGLSLPTITTDSISHNGTGSKQLEDKDVLRKKMVFFADLRECLNYNIEGNLPLHEGVIKNDLLVVKRQSAALKARKAGVNLENHDGCTPIQLAIVNNSQVEIVRILLDSGADIRDMDGDGNNILHLGAKFERLSALEVILNHKNFMSCFDCINGYNFEGLTPLMICCVASWTAGALLFINHRLGVNLKDQRSGKTALFHACEAQNVEIVQMLLNNGADPKVKNFFGTSPHDAMYELEDMDEAIKRLIFGISKKRSIVEAEMNPNRTAKAAKNLKTYRRYQKIKIGTNSFPIYTIVQK